MWTSGSRCGQVAQDVDKWLKMWTSGELLCDNGNEASGFRKGEGGGGVLKN